MAVTKIWQVKGSLADVVKYAGNPEKTKTHDLARVVEYASDEHKTVDENERFYAVTGVNCNAKTALAEMLAVQERFGKTGGNVAYHAYQSFKTGEVTPEQCHRLGVELAQKMWGAGLRWRPLIAIAIRSTDRAGRRDHNIRCWLRPILTRERCTTTLFFSRCVCGTAKNTTVTSGSITVCGSCPTRCAAARV